VLIQPYRTGAVRADYISEHSDKTIDVVRVSRIVNLSLGARRTMMLRTKKDDTANTNGNKQG
jgi:alkylated DNA repair dioxygenase AlkB